MLRTVENQGPCRKGFSLARRPPRVFKARRRGQGQSVPIFEPYEENLPLEAGYYSFVIGGDGRFRVKRGNLSSHSILVDREDVGAAGQFRINRAGNVAEVWCRSFDYRITMRDASHPTVQFVVAAFVGHHALEVSTRAVFQFSRGIADTFSVSPGGNLVTDISSRLRDLEAEGQGPDLGHAFRLDQIDRYLLHQPPRPLRVYEMHLDQLIIAVEGEDEEPFEYGQPMPAYSPSQPPLNPGKKAFVIDETGRFVVGPYGHHVLSGDRPVGGAGQVVVDEAGSVTEINLNFSGHYRPPLDAQYARYVYGVVRGHPLLDIAPDCRISGREFDASNELSTVLRFDDADLTSEAVDLDFLIEASAL